MLAKTEGSRRMRWLDSITDSVDMNVSKDRGACSPWSCGQLNMTEWPKDNNKQQKQRVQRPWGSDGNEPATITALSRWGRAESKLVQAGLYRAFCTLEKRLLSLNATGSHWRDSQERNRMSLTFFKGGSGCRREKETRQVVGDGKPGAKLQSLRGQAPSALHFLHCLQEATRALSPSYSSVTAVDFFLYLSCVYLKFSFKFIAIFYLFFKRKLYHCQKSRV